METLVLRMDEILQQLSADNQFMTLVIAELDPAAGSMRFANAGHHYPLHYRAASGTFELLESTGLPLGVLPRPRGPIQERPLQAGDLLAFYTDGLVEAVNAADEAFEIERLRQVLVSYRHQAARVIVQRVFEAVTEFCGRLPLHDDATIVVVRVLPEAENGGSSP